MDTTKVNTNPFPLDESPTMPQRAHSGALIKADVMRAFQAQHQADERCNRALDRLIGLLRTIEADRIPRRLRDSLRPVLSPGAYRKLGEQG